MKVDGSITPLIQGVSQQPARTRLPGQCTLQDNMTSNPVDGLQRRAPTEYLENLFAGTGAQWYDYELNGTRYFIAARNGNLRAFQLDGTEITVNNVSSAFSYLDGNPLAFATFDDITYVSNTSKTVAMSTGVSPYVETGSLVYLLGANYGRTYSITIKWGTASTLTVSWTAPDGSLAAHTAQIATDYIATQLAAALNANGTFTANFSVARSSDVLYIKKTSAPATDVFYVSVSDGDGGTNMLVANNSIPDAENLPRFAPEGYVVEVTGSGSADEDNWYLVFRCLPDSSGGVPSLGNGFGKEGNWLECVGPQVKYTFDATTMPHILEYDSGSNQFNFKSGAWENRRAGDEDSNPDPSFVGKTVNYISYFQGRLVFLAGPAVIMSRTNKPLDWFANSAVAFSDSDPIDMESTAEGVTEMLKAIPHNRDLVIFSNAGQFIVFGRNTITAKNSSLVLTTKFEAELSATPVAAGRNIFFGINYGAFTGIREFYTEGSQDINDSRPITQHVLKYIPGKIRAMATSSNFDVLIVQSYASKRHLFVYEYIWSGDKKAQSSWSRWIMPNDVEHFFFVESKLYMVTSVAGNYTLEVINLDMQADAGLEYQTKLDRKVVVTGVNTVIANPLPQMPDLNNMLFVQGAGCPEPGLRVSVKSNTSTHITFAKDMQGGAVICGQKYESKYRPTMPIVRDADGVKIGTGKLVVSKFFVFVRESGNVEYRKVSPYRDDSEVHYSGISVGTSLVGEPAVSDNTFILPFRDDTDNAEIELFTDSHLPMNILTIEWVGQYTKKGRRIGQGAAG